MIKKFTDLIELLEKLFGKGAVSRTIGTRTNVVRFPKGKQPVDPTTGEFRIEELKVENPDSYQIIKNSTLFNRFCFTRFFNIDIVTNFFLNHINNTFCYFGL